MTLKQRLEWLNERKLIMLFLCEDRYLNPLISSEMEKLISSGILNDVELWDVINKFFPKFETHLPTGMYFPVPICKLIKKGEDFSPKIALKFHYNFIKIDENQIWRLKNNVIKGKILKLFKSNLFFEKETNLYFIEYLSDNQWDKCYLECEITPMLAMNFVNKNSELMIQLNNQKIESIDLHSFRIDHKERCFVRSKNFGEVLLADAPRFWLLDNLDENGSNFVYEGKMFLIKFTK